MAQSTKKTLIPAGALVLGVKALFASGLYSDLTISCGGREFEVHRAILHPQSSVFAKLFSGKFAETGQAVIEVDDDPDVFQTLCRYFYHFVYDDSARQNDLVGPFTVRVYAIADKYDVKPLQDLAAMKLGNVSDPCEDMDKFIATIRTINEWCNPKDSTLWDILTPKITMNITFLLQNEKFRVLLTEMPGLNFNLLARLDPSYQMGSSGPHAPASRWTSWGTADDDEQNDEEQDDDQHDDFNLPFNNGGYHGPGRRLG